MFLLLYVQSYAQDMSMFTLQLPKQSPMDFVFSGNITNIKANETDDIENVIGLYRFNVSFSSNTIQFYDGNTNIEQNIIGFESSGFKTLIWTKESYYEIYRNLNNRPIIIMEFDLEHKLEYKQYYNKILKPIMSNG